MTVTTRSLWAALVATGLTGAGLFWHRHQLQREMNWLRQDNAHLQEEITARLHPPTPTARKQNSNVSVSPKNGSPTNSVISGDSPSVAPEPDYRNEGNATPRATLQTFAWACDQGDLATVMRLIQFDAPARIRALAFLAELPEDARKRWSTPEAMAAALLVDAGMHNPFPHATTLDTISTENISSDRVKLNLAGISRADSEYQRTAEGWKYAITSEAVEAYIAQSRKQ